VPITAVTSFQQGGLALGLGDGRALIGRFTFVLSHDKAGRKIEPKFKADPPVTLDPSGRPVTRLARAMLETGPMFAAATGPPRDHAGSRSRRKKASWATASSRRSAVRFPWARTGEISALVMDNRAEDLFAGLKDGRVVRVDLRDADYPKPAVPVACAKSGTAITALDLLNGDRTLVIGDAAGEVSAWQVLRSEEGSYYMVRCHEFDKHDAAVTAFSPSLRNKGFISTDARGSIHLNYATTSATLAEIPAGEAGRRRADAEGGRHRPGRRVGQTPPLGRQQQAPRVEHQVALRQGLV